MSSEATQAEAPASRWPTSDSLQPGTAQRSSISRRRTAGTAALLSLAYYLGVKAGFALTPETTPTSLLWPPNAIVLGVLLLSPKRSWPVLMAAVFPAHLLAELSENVPVSMVLGWFVSNMFEALIGAWSIQFFLRRPLDFTRLQDFASFLVCGACLAPVLSSFLDASLVVTIGWGDAGYWGVWRTRTFSNALASLILVPLIVTWVRSGLKPLRQKSRRQLLEASAVMAGIMVSSVLVLFERHTISYLHTTFLYMPLPFALLLPFLMWAAVRLSVGELSLCIAIVAAIAVSGLLYGRGPFVLDDPDAGVMAVQVFLITVAATFMSLSVSLAELRQTRQEARDRGERLQLALAAAHMGTWDWMPSKDRITSYVSGTGDSGEGRLLLGSFDDVLQRIHPEDRTRVAEAIARAASGTDRFDEEFRWMSDGTERWAVAKGTFIAHEGSRSMVGIHMDVTDRKLQEVQLQAQRDQLAHLGRVAMLGELSGALAHELNQPLTTILTNAQATSRMLQTEAPNLAEVRDAVADIAAQGRRAADVIHRLRTLFKRGKLEERQVDLNECVREALDLERSELVARNVRVDVQLTADLPPVMADPVRLQQVLLNLILNACDAMRGNPPGDRLLNVRTSLAEGPNVLVEIEDCGSGIEHLDKIFEPFYTTKHHGLGLGLPICRTIVETHRGCLWATNNPLRGATLHVALPATVSSAVDDSSHASAAGIGSAPQGAGT